jgi:predicted PurR-regulated permease PerM
MQLTVTQKTALAWTAIAAVLAMLLWVLTPVLAPFVVAFVMAYALTPAVDRLDALLRRRVARTVIVVVVELLFLLLLLALGLLIVPILAKELPQMRDQLPTLLDSLNALVKQLMAPFGFKVSLDLGSVKAFLMKYLNTNYEDALGSLLTSLRLGGSVAFALLGNAVLIPVVLFYLMVDWDVFMGHLRALVPPRLRPSAQDFMHEVDTVLGQYLRGQLLVMALLAVFYSVGLSAFGLDLAVPIGIFTGLAVFVPYLGFGLGLVLATLAGLLEFSSTSGVGYALTMVAVVFGLGQLVEGFFLTPRLVGERIGLHPLAVIFALLAFGQVLGFVGVLVALPASAVLLVGIRRIRTGYLSSRLYQG